METGAVGEAEIDVGRCVVEPTASRGRQPLGQPAYRCLVGEGDRAQLEAAPAIEIDGVRPVDEHVGDPGGAQQRLERAGADHVAPQRVVDRQHGGVPDGAPSRPQRPGDAMGGQLARLPGQPFAHRLEVAELRLQA